MLSSSTPLSTLSGREVVKRLKISPRRLPQLEIEAKIKIRNSRIPPLKRRYTLKEVRKLERISGHKENIAAFIMGGIVLVAMVFCVIGFFKVKSFVNEGKNTASKTERAIPAQQILNNGLNMLRRGNTIEARSLFQSIVNCGDHAIEEEANYYYLESFKENKALYLQMLKSYISAYPDAKNAGEVVFNLANFYYQEMLIDDAKKYYSIMQTQYPDHPLTPAALSELVRIYTQAEKFDEAVKTAEYLASRYPGSTFSPSAIYSAAMLLIGKLNHNMAGLELLEKLQRDYPNYNSTKILLKIEELSQDWDKDGKIYALEKDQGSSDGEDPWNKP